MLRQPATAVADTNVIVSAFLAPRPLVSRALMQLSYERKLICSKETLSELEEVWFRPKFDKYAPHPIRSALFWDFGMRLHIIHSVMLIQACRDSKDDKFLALAISGGAELIMTGDADLLELNPFRGIAIVTPADYLASVSGKGATAPET